MRAIKEDRTAGRTAKGQYLLPPDRFVARLDRQPIEAAITDRIRANRPREEWHVADNEEHLWLSTPDATGFYQPLTRR